MSARQGVQLGAAAVGFAVGAYFGQPQLGLAVGSLLGAVVAQVAFPLDPIVNRQDNVADMAITSAALGVFKPIVYGVWPLAGNIIWIYPPIAIEHTESSTPEGGGKGGFGGPKQVTITTTYRRHGMVALCEGPVSRLTRIYVDATLLYDEAQPEGWTVSAGQPNGDPGGDDTTDPPDTILYEKASADQLQKFVLFRGTATQEPWAFAESLEDVGAGTLPAYRHTAVVGFTLDLGPTGRLPNLRFEVSTTVEALGTPVFVHWLPTDSALWSIWHDGATPLAGAGFAVQYDPFAVTPITRALLHRGLAEEPETPAGNRIPAATALAQTSAGLDALAIQRSNATLAVLASTGGLVVDDLDPRTDAEREQNIQLLTGYPSLCARPNAQDGRLTTLVYTLGQLPALGQCETQSAAANFQRLPLPSAGFQVVWNATAAALYVSLPTSGTVARVTGTSPLVLAEQIPCGTEPTALLVARDGTCWVTDQGGNAVYQFTTTGDRSAPIVVGDAPGHLAEASDNAIWVATQGARAVARISMPGHTVTQIPLPDYPTLVAAGLDGTCWVLTPASRMVYQVQEGGTLTGMQVPRDPVALTVDAQGQCWVVCSQARAVVRVGADATTAAYPETHNALACVVRDLNLRAGVPPAWIDVSGLDATPVNYAIFGSAAATRPLEDLAMAFQFLAVETGLGLKYLFKGGSSVATIAEAASLVTAQEGQGSLTVERAQPQELPTEVTVVYPAPSRHFHTAEQTIQRPHDGPRVAVVHNSPVAFDDAQMARNLAEILLYEPAFARYAATVELPPMASRIEPGDLVTLTTTEGQTYDVRLVRSTLGVDNRVQWDTIRHRSYLYEGFAAFPAEEPGGEVIIPHPAAVELFLVEYPPLDDDVESLRLGFAVARQSGVGEFFPVTTIFESVDGGATYQAVMLCQTAATVGTVASVPDPVQVHTWDRSSVLTVVLRPGSPALTAASEEAPHYAMLGQECIAFVQVTATALDTYELRTLYRGSRGTEQRASAHPVNERFVLLNATIRNRTRTFRPPDVGLTRHYKAVPSGTNITAVGEQPYALAGVHGRPWAPVLLSVTRDIGTGDWTLTWLHRSRVRGGWIDLGGINYDLDDVRSYVLHLYNGYFMTSVVASHEIAAPPDANPTRTYVYTAAAQVADFGITQPALYFGLAQRVAGVAGEEAVYGGQTGVVRHPLWAAPFSELSWPPGTAAPLWQADFLTGYPLWVADTWGGAVLEHTEGWEPPVYTAILEHTEGWDA